MPLQRVFPVRSLFLGLMALAIVGCGGGAKTFTPDDFKKVEKGMTEQQVKDLLGNPKEDITSSDGGARRLFWIVGDKYYSISFDKDKKVIEPLPHGSREDYEMMKGLMKMKI